MYTVKKKFLEKREQTRLDTIYILEESVSKKSQI